ncbi:MAG TPA: hypothetical protein VHC70_09985, partial [Phycisphaerales bacterium]|nr:hypothetical protein [Phycisphaerales bacterium]
GINIEHGRENRIVGNTFTGDSVGVRLWGRHGSSVERTPWGLANGEVVPGAVWVLSTRNVIEGNTFTCVAKDLWIRDTVLTRINENELDTGGSDLGPYTEGDPRLADPESPANPEPIGARRAVGARMDLEGRDQIVMGEFGPWDHESVMVRKRGRDERGDVYEVWGARARPVEVAVLEGGIGALHDGQQMGGGRAATNPVVVHVSGGAESGVWPYRVRITAGEIKQEVSGTIVNAAWDVRVWAWEHDPLKDVAAWRAEADGAGVVRSRVGAIDWALGYQGPGCIAPEVRAAKIGANHYGVIASTRIHLQPGRWAVKTLSDDGIRVRADGKTVIERWDIHGPTADAGVVEVERARDVEIGVEYFQNDGYAVLRVGIEHAAE